MFYVVLLAVAIWLAGAAAGVAPRLRWLAVLGLFFAVPALLALLPAGHAVPRTLGGTPAAWLVLAGALSAALGYAAWLAQMRRRAVAAPGGAAVAMTAATPGTGGGARPAGAMTGEELQRYARHIMLREIGGPGQKKLKSARVLVVGAGGLGAPALMYLAAAGVGRITVIDDDVVELSNLQRQIIHTEARIGEEKAHSAVAAMRALNPYVSVEPLAERLTEKNAASVVAGHDLVLDGCDSFETRYLVNRTCARAGVPLISAALSQWEGQISLFDPARGAPCYRCIFPEAPAPGLAPSCAEAGVAGPLPGVLGAMMAVEAVKEIAGAGQGLRGRMMIYDALFAETRTISLARRADCADCGELPE